MATKKIEIIYDIDGKAIDVALDKTLNLQQSVKALTSELRKTKEGTVEFSLLTNKLNDTKDNLDRVNAKSKEFFGTLSLLPGPVGQFSNQIDNSIGLLKTFSGFKLNDIKNQLVGLGKDILDIGAALLKVTGIEKIYNMTVVATTAVMRALGISVTTTTFAVRALSAALVTTGVGALVVALGYLITKLMEVGKEADLTAGNVAKLDRELNKLSTDAKINGDELIAQMKAQGKTDEEIYQKKKKIKQNELDLARQSFKQYQGQMDAAEVMEQKGSEGYKKALEGRLEAEKKIKQSKHELVMMEFEEEERIRKNREAKNKEADQKRIQQNKQTQEKIIQDNKTADEILTTNKRENNVLILTDERDRQRKELENQKLAEKDKLNDLQISTEKKNRIIAQIDEKYGYKLKDLNKKFKEEDIKAGEEFTNKLGDISISAIKDETNRQIAERREKYRRDLVALEEDKEFIKMEETTKAHYRQELKDALDNDVSKIEHDNRVKKLDEELKFMQIRNEGIRKGTIQFFDAQRELLDKSQERELSQLDLTEQQKTDIKAKYAALRKDIDKQEVETYIGYVNAGLTATSNFISQQQQINSLAMANELAEVKGNAEAEDKIKEKYFYKNRDAQVGQAIISTLQSAVSAYSSLAVIPIVGPALGAIAAAAALAFGYKQVNLIKAQTYQSSLPTASGAEASKPAMANYGENYGDGGMIEGPRHASGGVMINAEGGEAVMTRGAVTMFAPLLSAMNQMGGGTSFSKGALGQANNDNPKTTSVITQPQIVKTYVVSSDLTTEAQKQARLKDLSTL